MKRAVSLPKAQVQAILTQRNEMLTGEGDLTQV